MSTFKYAFATIFLSIVVASSFSIANAGEGPHEINGKNVFERWAEQRETDQSLALAEDKKPAHQTESTPSLSLTENEKPERRNDN